MMKTKKAWFLGGGAGLITALVAFAFFYYGNLVTTPSAFDTVEQERILQRPVPQEPVGKWVNEKVEEAVMKTEKLPVSSFDTPTAITLPGHTRSMLVANNKDTVTPRKIIFSLPGHGTEASQGLTVWKPHLEETDYILASVDWWDGEGERKEDYLSPQEVESFIADFLKTYGFTKDDLIILEGFSRGSGNTYSVKALDEAHQKWIDAVISASGEYEKDFPLGVPLGTEAHQVFPEVSWVLVCGGKDSERVANQCAAMRETEKFLKSEGVNILGFLEDPNEGHGAFHMSKLKLPAKALKLIESAAK